MKTDKACYQINPLQQKNRIIWKSRLTVFGILVFAAVYFLIVTGHNEDTFSRQHIYHLALRLLQSPFLALAGVAVSFLAAILIGISVFSADDVSLDFPDADVEEKVLEVLFIIPFGAGIAAYALWCYWFL